MNEWNIQSRAHSCETCGKTYADKEHYHTLLIDAKHELKRSDICDDCWKKSDSTGDRERKGFISYWQGIYEAPAPVAEVIQKDTAETLLRKLIEMNERKRLLRVKEQFKREGKRVFVYEQPKTGDIFTIIDPDLQLDQLAEVQRDVANLLEHGFDAVVNPGEAGTKPVEVAATIETPEAPAVAVESGDQTAG